MKIFKYPFANDISMPKGAQIVHVGLQRENLMIWAMVDEFAEKEERHFKVYNTGAIIDPAHKYLGTVMVNFGSIVWHVFEIV